MALQNEKRKDRFWRNNMYTALPFILLLALIFWGLSKTTEKVLAIRQDERDAGKKPNVYL